MKKAKKTGGGGAANPNSLANLKPAQPGEVRNPAGTNGVRPYTDAILAVSAAPLPEYLRAGLNVRFRAQCYMLLKDQPEYAGLLPEDIPDLYPAKITWAQANAVREHLAAVLEGEIGASVDVREAVEGRATTRVEFISQNDKLEELLGAFRLAAQQPGIIEETTVIAVLPPSNGSGDSGNTNGSGNT